ncbi:uncharacterized protein G2W53_007419 [Senna tora]|uniref:Uncharacterized protein n=1 Tax=Senna tora TaxID=362788 RepID=A0A835CHA0_9FABA|nr:uncharacterized protein G2W53_007419 [Senna tora]
MASPSSQRPVVFGTMGTTETTTAKPDGTVCEETAASWSDAAPDDYLTGVAKAPDETDASYKKWKAEITW